MTITPLLDHPAKFSAPVLGAILDLLDTHAAPDDPKGPPKLRALDPFAGPGGVHELMEERAWLMTEGVELEPEWAAAHPRTRQGDALALPFETASFDALITSPCYGNRMADKHEARDACKACKGSGCAASPDCLGGHPDDGNHRRCPKCKGTGLSKRHTYRHTLGRPLSDNSAAGLQWGAGYRAFHHAAWQEARRVLKPETPDGEPGALVLLNISNHIRDDAETLVVEWHLTEWLNSGARLVDMRRVETRRQGHGANREKRVDCEFVLALRCGPAGGGLW